MQDLPATSMTFHKTEMGIPPLRSTIPEVSSQIVFCGPDEQCQSVERAAISIGAKFDRCGSFDNLRSVATEVSPAIPLLCIVDVFELRNGDLQVLSKSLDEHPFCRILVLSEQNLISTHRIKYHPGLPVRFVPLPVDYDLLKGEISAFNESMTRLARYLKMVARLDDLDLRERTLASMVAAGEPNKKSARVLGLAEKTVEKCRATIYRKLGVSSTAELTSLVVLREYFRWSSSELFGMSSNPVRS